MKSPRLPLLALATLLLAACETGPDRKAMMDEVRHSVPPMAAHEPFFDGQIAVYLTLSSNVAGAALFGGHDGKSEKMVALATTAPGEDRFGDGGMGGMGGGMGGMGGGMGGMGGSMGSSSPAEMQSSDSGGEHESRKGAKGGTYQGNAGMNHIADVDEGESPAARRVREAQMPPALLRLRLENPSAATVVVEIREVNSDLGDFAVRPDTVTLLPGQAIEVEPMQSMLGVESYALPVTITLRAGGQTQSKVLTLRPVAPAPGTPPPTAPPPGT